MVCPPCICFTIGAHYYYGRLYRLSLLQESLIVVARGVAGEAIIGRARGHAGGRAGGRSYSLKVGEYFSPKCPNDPVLQISCSYNPTLEITTITLIALLFLDSKCNILTNNDHGRLHRLHQQSAVGLQKATFALPQHTIASI